MKYEKPVATPLGETPSPRSDPIWSYNNIVYDNNIVAYENILTALFILVLGLNETDA